MPPEGDGDRVECPGTEVFDGLRFAFSSDGMCWQTKCVFPQRNGYALRDRFPSRLRTPAIWLVRTIMRLRDVGGFRPLLCAQKWHRLALVRPDYLAQDKFSVQAKLAANSETHRTARPVVIA